jgi:hypothetical protein
MKRTTITVPYTRTQNLGDYSNVKPGIVLGAELEEGDDYEACKAQLLAEARATVEEEIDRALEASDQPAKFSAVVRYRLLYTSERWASRPRGRDTRLVPPEKILVLAPDAFQLAGQASERWLSDIHQPCRKLRLEHARRRAAEWIDERSEREEFRLIDCADGDLSRIPPWALVPPVEPEYTQQEAAEIAATWYIKQLWAAGLDAQPLLQTCLWVESREIWRVALAADGVPGPVTVELRAGDEPQILAPVSAGPAPEGCYDDEPGEEDDEPGEEDAE